MGAGHWEQSSPPCDGRTWKLPAELGSVRRARRESVAHAAGSPVDLDDLALVVSELVTNAVEHGDGGDVVLTVRTGSGGAEVEVSNAVAGGAPLPRAGPFPGPDQAKGRGLAIARVLCRSLLIEEGDDHVTVRARLGPAG